MLRLLIFFTVNDCTLDNFETKSWSMLRIIFLRSHSNYNYYVHIHKIVNSNELT